MHPIRFGLLAFVLLASFFTSSPTAHAEQFFTGQETILKGLGLSYRLRFDEARELFSSLGQTDPASPAGMFYTGAVDWGINESELRWRRVAKLYATTAPPKRPALNAEKVLANMEKTIKLCREILEKNRDDFEALFYMGGAYGFTARVKMYQSHYFSAMVNGRRSATIFDQLLESYPERGDSMLAPGVFRYYVGRLSPPLRWIVALLGLSGNKEEGLSLMKQAYERSILSSIESADFLTRIYRMHEGDNPKALEWADALEREVPDAPLADFHRVIIYHRMGEIAKEEKSTKRLIAINQSGTPKNIRESWEPLLAFNLGAIKEKMGLKVEASELFEAALLMKGSGEWLKGEIRKRLSNLKSRGSTGEPVADRL